LRAISNHRILKKESNPMNSRILKFNPIVFATIICASMVWLCGSLRAQTFQSVAALNFTMPAGGGNPLPQMVTIASTTTSINFYQKVTTNNGGNWLSITQCNNSLFPCTTPSPVAVTVSASTLTAGTYTGQIVFTDVNNTGITLTVPVTLTVEAATAPFFSYLPGGLSFTIKTGGGATSQPVQILNGGTGTLSWALTASTGIGSNWITASAARGTAPATISIGINTANLPGGGAAGTYVGQLQLKTTGDTTTIPIAVTVGSPVFEQVNPLTFTMPAGGASPLPQVLNIESTSNSAISYFQTSATSNGGNWLTVTNCNNSLFPCDTPYSILVGVQNASSLAAGTYMGQVAVYQDTNPQMSLVIPVTLNVVASGAFFSNLPGALSFSFVSGGLATAQNLQIANGGTGSLTWKVSATTSDGSAWLTTNVATGTAPSEVSVDITPGNLPGTGDIAGTYTGQLLFQSAISTETILVAVTVGANVFYPLNPISFTMPVGGANPLPQVLNVATTVANTPVTFWQAAHTGTGGNWLSVTACNNSLFPCSTPYPVTVAVQNATTLAAGVYTGEVVISQDTNPQMSMTVPVTLNVVPSGAYFNNLPGQLSFSLVQNGTATPQTIQIQNKGLGKLAWTVTAATSDGGAWLSTTPTSGTAPTEVTVSVTPAALPGNGAISGTYTGELFFQAGSDTATIPITVAVGPNVFNQINPISFTMPAGGSNPLPQILTIGNSQFNSGLSFWTSASVTDSTVSWLSVPSCNNSLFPCKTPTGIAVNVQNASTLPAGVYTGEVNVYEDTNPAASITVPVVLYVVGSGAFFNNLPGQMSFTMPQSAASVTPQSLEITSVGTGKLAFSITPSTADGGAWLTATALSGVAPKIVNVEIVPGNLPGAGALAGTYEGQLLLISGADTETIPVTVTVGNGAFAQVNPINFVMETGGADPLPQMLTIAGIGGASLSYYEVTSTATGGSWLNVTWCNNSLFPCTTADPIYVGIKNTNTLAAGTYTGQITFFQSGSPEWTITVPVTLTVVPSTQAFFDIMPGQSSFSFIPGTRTLQTQTLYLDNGGAGTLSWKIATNTADGNKWLAVTPATGTNAGSYKVEVSPTKLPNQGASAGTFVGQELLQTASGNVTIPVVVTVGASVFVPVPTVVFETSQGGTPPPQEITIQSTGTSFNFYQITTTGKGNNWLQIANNACNNSLFPCPTPTTLTLSGITSGLPVGTYTAEINVIESGDPNSSMTIAVVLNLVN